jgi:hypothetical protein
LLRLADKIKTIIFSLLSALLIVLAFANPAGAQKIVEVSPLPNAAGVPVDQDIQVKFDTEIDASTLNANTFVVYGEKSGRIAGTIGYDSSTQTATFSPLESYLPGERILAVVPEQVWTSDGNSAISAFIWEFDVQAMQGSEEFTQVSFKVDMSLEAVATADFDGDDICDIALSGRIDKGAFLQIFYYKNGTFNSGDQVPLDFPARPMYVADLNGDSITDILLVHQLNQGITVCFVKANGKLDLGSTIIVGKKKTEPRSAILEDLNEDGYIDIALFMRSYSKNADALISVLLNDGKGNFSTGEYNYRQFFVDAHYASSGECLFARDFNGDGFVDLALTSSGSSSRIALFMNPGDGLMFPDVPSKVISLENYNGGDLESAFSGDLSGDHLPDILAVDYDGNRYFSFLHQGVQGGLPDFSAPEIQEVNQNPFWTDYGDFDADGDLDVAMIGNRSSDFITLFNDGAGHLNNITSHQIPRAPRMFAIGDFDNDQALDFVIADSSGEVTFLINDTAGNHSPEAPVLLSPESGTFSRQLEQRLVWKAPKDSDGDKLHFIVEIDNLSDPGSSPIFYDSRIIPDQFSPNAPVPEGSEQVSIDVTFPAEGDYRWNVTAFDGKVNSPTSRSSLLGLDLTAPSALNLSFPDAGFGDHWIATQNSNMVDVELTYSELHADKAILETSALAGTLENADVPPGVDQQVVFQIPVQNEEEGRYDLSATVLDMAGNQNQIESWLGIDTGPPVGTLASVSEDTSLSETIYVTWEGGTDGSGSGLSGLYSVRIRVDDGQWQAWLDSTAATESLYQGMHKHHYAFEAAAYDHLGQMEEFLGLEEATVYVDTTADDLTPPGKPIGPIANGKNPSDWFNGDEFVIEWQVPPDKSGVTKSFWKKGQPPLSNDDYDGTAGPAGPIYYRMEEDGQLPLYIWLADARDNVDYKNYASVLLRRDTVSPVIHQVVFTAPEPQYVSAENIPWYNANRTPEFRTRISYSESHLRLIEMDTGGLAGVLQRTNLANADSNDVELLIRTSDASDGIYDFTITLSDSANNQAVNVKSVGMDKTAPFGCVASADSPSYSPEFLVSWSSGSDPSGSGLSGSYNIYMKRDSGPWTVWLSETTLTNSNFIGEYGHSYDFEAISMDNVGNLEKITGQAETRVRVIDPTEDNNPPATPITLSADSENPNPWKSTPDFSINWVNPDDSSGIVKSWYKYDNPPTSNVDTSGSAEGSPPVQLMATKEDGQWLYLWLEDGKGNSDYRNNASVLLKWDGTEPVIDSTVFIDPMYGKNWYNPSIIDKTRLAVYVSENHLRSVDLSSSLDIQSSAAAESHVKFFQISFPLSADTTYTINVTATDSAGNAAFQSVILALDDRPPFGTTAVSPAKKQPGEFLVTWGGASDGHGVGISGVYDVRVKIDDEDWQPWKVRFNGEEARYTGEEGHSYSFEAAAYDFLGNRELLNGVAETTTQIDVAFVDNEPPGSPENLAANGSTPSPWSSIPLFEIQWDNPDDSSGIARCYYKIGSPPSSADDTTGSGSAIPPLRINLVEEGEVHLYLWLEDGSGNADFSTAKDVLLRYDATPPKISQSLIRNAQFNGSWINPDSIQKVEIRTYYDETYADSAQLAADFLESKIVKTDIGTGVGQYVDYEIELPDVADNCYKIFTIISDSAGNIAIDSLQLCIDGTAPSGAKAVSPATSLSNYFTVSWEGGNRGSDGQGSGLSGEYDVFIRIDNNEWYPLLEKAKTLTTSYVGVQGHTYSFEVAAWDNVGNREEFTGTAETTTMIDTLFIDSTPPEPPRQLAVKGQTPGGWQNNPLFEVSWENPVDPSGIAKIYYKLGSPPQSNTDTTGTKPVSDSILIQASEQYAQDLFLWLQDGKGNVDFKNHSRITLKYDATRPVLNEMYFADPDFGLSFYNQAGKKEAQIGVVFDERIPYRMQLRSAFLSSPKLMDGLFPAKGDSVVLPLSIQNLTDGSYWVSIVLEDSAGNVSEPDSLLLNLDSTPPVISYQQLGNMATENTPVEIRAVIKDNNRVERGWLQYWQGGQRTKSTLDMAPLNDSTYSATIPAASVTNRGLEYILWGSDGLSNAREPKEGSRYKSYSVRVKVTGKSGEGIQKPEELIFGRDDHAYRMISLPIEVDDPSAQAVLEDDLGAYDSNDWRFFYWNMLDAEYLEYPKTGPLLPGKAFWLITAANGKKIDTGPGISIDTAEPFVMPLRRGWNDIGNPFNFAVEWRDIFVASATDTQKVFGPYTYQGDWLLKVDLDKMLPWEGYTFYTEYDDISLTIPPLEARTALQKSAKRYKFKNTDWYYSIAVKIDNAMDSGNYFGFSERATKEWDYDYDFVEPPNVGSYVSLAFPHEEYELFADRYTSDFRNTQEGDIWHFEVSSNMTDKEAELSFHKHKPLPANYHLTLVDQEANLSVNLLADSSYSFWISAREPVRHFKIIVGDDNFINAQQHEMPEEPSEYSLVQNYPNPFNGSTMISYELKKTIQVKIAIYNLLAQRVKFIYEGKQEKGYHQYRWDARDDNDRELGTGIYILRLETSEFTSTRKMIFMR